MASDRDFYAMTIGHALACTGGYETLALILNVQLQDLIAWSRGSQRPPTQIFLRIIDLAVEGKTEESRSQSA